MSLHTFTSENINLVPRPSSRQRVQCCSFCRQHGHNITRCNSERLLEFEVICADVVRNFHNHDDFKIWLVQNYANEPNLLKAFAIRKFRITSTNTLNVYIDYITEYIFRIYKNIPQLESENNATHDIVTNDNVTNDNVTNDNVTNDIDIALLDFIIRLINRSQIIEPETEILNTTSVLREYISYLSGLRMTLMRNEYNLPQSVIQLRIETNEENDLSENYQCSICWDDKELRQFVKLNCNHEFCKECIIKTLTTNTLTTNTLTTNTITTQTLRSNLCCALCRSDISTFTTHTQELHDELLNTINT